EQSIGGIVDRRSDLFSLGIVLYEAATGRLPFSGATPFETMDRIRHSEPEALAGVERRLPGDLDRIVRKCLAKDPAVRYQSAGELLADLRILERRGEAASPAALPDGPAHNLPADLTTFVGRSKEVE